MINESKVKKYCKEDISKIKNYDLAIADKTQVWECHHMTETWWNCSAKELIENECYYGRKACELIFLTPDEHKSLHHKGKHLSEETRKKLSEANKGKIMSDESRRKMSESHKGKTHSDETRKKLSEALKGKSSHKCIITSKFGKAFKEHYGLTASDDIKLYKKEYSFYVRNGKFSWN